MNSFRETAKEGGGGWRGADTEAGILADAEPDEVAVAAAVVDAVTEGPPRGAAPPRRGTGTES